MPEPATPRCPECARRKVAEAHRKTAWAEALAMFGGLLLFILVPLIVMWLVNAAQHRSLNGLGFFGFCCWATFIIIRAIVLSDRAYNTGPDNTDG